MNIPNFLNSTITFLANGKNAVTEALPEDSIISFDKETLISLGFILLNVLILIVILILLLYKPVRRYMDNRSEGIKNNLDEAERALTGANQLKEEYEEKLRGIEAERKKELENANKRASERCDLILKEAYEEAESIKTHALAEIEEERRNVQSEINKQLVELSVLISSRFIEDNIDEKTHEKYIEQALSDWEEGL